MPTLNSFRWRERLGVGQTGKLRPVRGNCSRFLQAAGRVACARFFGIVRPRFAMIRRDLARAGAVSVRCAARLQVIEKK